MKLRELSEVRIERGYSLKDVADHIGIGWMSLREYEAKPDIIPISLACEMLNFYRVSIDEVNFCE